MTVFVRSFRNRPRWALAGLMGALLTVLMLSSSSGTSAAVSAIFCADGSIVFPPNNCPSYAPLSVDATVTTAYTRTHHWAVSISPDRDYAGYSGDSWDPDFTVAVDKQGYADAWLVNGTIAIHNPYTTAATITEVTSGIPGAAVACGVTFPYTLPANGNLKCTFDAALSGGGNWGFTAWVATSGAIVGRGDLYTASFPGSPTPVNDSVNVSVAPHGEAWVFNDDGSQTYSHNYDCFWNEGDNVVTATIDETGQSDSVTVALSLIHI